MFLPVLLLYIWIHQNNKYAISETMPAGMGLTSAELNFKVARSWIWVTQILMSLVKTNYYLRVNPEFGKGPFKIK